MKKIVLLVGMICIVLISACDPRTYGTVYIRNYTTQKIKIEFKGRSPLTDSVRIINPDEKIAVLDYGHWGHPKNYDCCPCEFDEIKLTAADTTRRISKDVKDKNKWTIDKSKLTRSNYVIDCYFDVRQSHIH